MACLQSHKKCRPHLLGFEQGHRPPPCFECRGAGRQRLTFEAAAIFKHANCALQVTSATAKRYDDRGKHNTPKLWSVTNAQQHHWYLRYGTVVTTLFLFWNLNGVRFLTCGQCASWFHACRSEVGACTHQLDINQPSKEDGKTRGTSPPAAAACLFIGWNGCDTLKLVLLLVSGIARALIGGACSNFFTIFCA